MTKPETRNDGSGAFVTTRWTQVLRAKGSSPEARAALGELCGAYWAPVYRFIRRERDEQSARDLTQEFFARLLSGNGINEIDPARGTFRSFLLGAVKHFLTNVRRRELRLKRGGGAVIESMHAGAGCLDCPEDTGAFEIADPKAERSDAYFDRQWALAVMDRALRKLEEEYAGGKEEQFHVLKQWLAGEPPELSQAQAARQLGMGQGTVKVAIHRMRKRFREAVRAEIAQTLHDPVNVDAELSYLIEALVC